VVVTRGTQAAGAAAGALAELTTDGSRLRRLRSAGFADEYSAPYADYAAEARVPAADAVREGRPVILEGPADMAARYPELASTFAAMGTGAAASLPFTVDVRIRGVLSLSWPEPRSFRPEDRAFLLALAHESGQALVRARLLDAERRA